MINKVLKARGSNPKVYIVDNECSIKLKEDMKKYEIYIQLAPPHMHRRNSAEWVIRAYKNHFISGFSTTDPDFPLSEWDLLISQCAITLNLLQNFRVNPALSAYAYLFGLYDFNKSPMAPPGTRVIAHAKPGNWTSWGNHGTLGWYIGPSIDHYRCMQCYVSATGTVIITDTLQYTPKTFAFPKTTTEYYLRQAIGDIIAIMKKPPKKIPFLSYGDATKNLINQIDHI